MHRTPLAAVRTTAALIVALLFAAPAPARAQDEEEGEKIQQLLEQAMEHMTAASGLAEKAKGAQGADADKARAEANGRWDQACDVYAQVLERLSAISGNDEMKAEVRGLCHYNTACARSLQGKKEEALTAFGAALDDGFDDWDHIAKDTDLDAIRQEPRFLQLVERARSTARDDALAEARKQLSTGAMFPYELSVTGLDGQKIELAALRGKVVIVDYWGTWCPPCRAEIPHLADLKKEMGDKLAIVGLTWENGQGGPEVEAKVKAFAAENGMTWPLALLTDRNDLQKVPEFRGFPTTLFIDKQGRVRCKEVGYRDLETLRALVQALDAEPADGAAPTPPASGSQPF